MRRRGRRGRGGWAVRLCDGSRLLSRFLSLSIWERNVDVVDGRKERF
jgi:hypothetical protein